MYLIILRPWPLLIQFRWRVNLSYLYSRISSFLCSSDALVTFLTIIITIITAIGMKVSLARPSLPGRRVAILLSLCSFVSYVKGQTCYYPNGNASTSTDFPCSLEADSPCCPQGWQCLSNGLCYLENENYLGRYTCTDQTWQSTACPQICTYGNPSMSNRYVP